MAKILKDLPLFSLIQVSPYLYNEILEKMGQDYPLFMNKIKNIKVESFKKVAAVNDIMFVSSPKNRVAVALSIIEVETNQLCGIATIEVTLPQFYGETARVYQAVNQIFNTDYNFVQHRSGIILSIALCEDNTPVLTHRHGTNGNSQRFYAARKELS